MNKTNIKSFCLHSVSKRIFYLLLLTEVILFNACSRDSVYPEYNNYPAEVGELLVTHCAGKGCHNSQSAVACAGLDLSSWDKLFQGSGNNAAVVPYRPDQSFLLFSVNTYSELGPQLTPTMPLNNHPFSKDQVLLLRDWIAQGAPDKKGYVKFSENPNRSKIFVANQGCDFVTVYDADSKLIMRCIDVGTEIKTEAPHDMFTSPDGKYLYVSFFTSNLFQKFNTATGALAGSLLLPDISWHSMAISGNSKYALVSHLDANGKVCLLDLDNMSIVETYQGTGFLVYPHGIAMNYAGDTAYIVCQQGNFIYKLDLKDPHNPNVSQVPLVTNDIPTYNGMHKPYEVEFSPDYKEYFVSCQGTNELRVFNYAKDSLISVLPMSGVPQLMVFSEKFPYAFISCMEDSANLQTFSTIEIIDYKQKISLGNVVSGYQPRGLTIDDKNSCVWIANRNINKVGWAPHHTTSCGGRNGYVTIIDMNTLQLIPGWKSEVSVDPYTVTIKK